MAKKKKFIVLARNPKIQQKGLITGRGKRVFGEKSALWISDEAEAREIEHQYGMKGSKDVAVTTDQQYEWSVNNEGGNGTRMDNIHHYTFGPMTSRAAEEFWERYEAKKKAKAKPEKKRKTRATRREVKHGIRS
jgi:hypothetical protein